eukprot:COSAG05_NODE_193_length_14574_cov_23.070812_5_plen_143_part_00
MHGYNRPINPPRTRTVDGDQQSAVQNTSAVELARLAAHGLAALGVQSPAIALQFQPRLAALLRPPQTAEATAIECVRAAAACHILGEWAAMADACTPAILAALGQALFWPSSPCASSETWYVCTRFERARCQHTIGHARNKM